MIFLAIGGYSVPTVAVVIPCWNAERWVTRAIQSSLDQDYPDLEVIVIDDGSHDGSLDVIRSFGSRIRWLSTQHGDACSARNAGLKMTTAEYVCFLDADDYLLPWNIGNMMATANGKPDLVIDRLRLDLVDNHIQIRELPFCQEDEPKDYIRRWLLGDNANTAAILWRRSFLADIGNWNEGMPRLQDLELAIRGFLAGPIISLCTNGGSVYVKHDSPDRISQRRSRYILESDQRYLAGLSAQLFPYTADIHYALGVRCYRLAAMAYQHGAIDIAEDHLRMARTCGLTGHIGTAYHRILVALCGYRYKVFISTWINLILARIRRAWSHGPLGHSILPLWIF